VFDLYNTLFFLQRETYPIAQLMQGLDSITPDDIKKVRYVLMTKEFSSVVNIVEYFWSGLSLDVDRCEEEIAKDLASATLYPETMDVLSGLRDSGLKLGLVSNISSLFEAPFFNFGLDSMVDDYILSCRVGYKKPEVEIYQMMLAKFNLSPQEVLMVGDSLQNDYHGANNAGMDALLLDRENKSDLDERITSLSELLKIKCIN
jgi:HAD superfamily hydrolase (TIGR01662 family)